MPKRMGACPIVRPCKCIALCCFFLLFQDCLLNPFCSRSEQIRWWRIICDESHVLRTANAKSEAVMKVPADHKWLVSGTPISTTITDITQQMKFLGIRQPSTIVTAFRNSIGSAIGSGSNKKGRRGRSWRHEESNDKLYFGKFTWFMRSLMIRHSQNMKYSSTQTTLMSLPSKVRISTLPYRRVGLCALRSDARYITFCFYNESGRNSFEN